MKNNKIVIGITALLLIVLSGCQLANNENTVDENMNEDIFMGFYITTELLPFTEDDTKFYATTNGNNKFVFEDFEGIPFYSTTLLKNSETSIEISSKFGDGISDASIDVHVGTSTKDLSLRGTLFVIPEKNTVYYFHQIYWSNDNRIYLSNGNGVQLDEDITSEYTFSTKTEITRDNITTLLSVSANIILMPTELPSEINILQMDSNHNILKTSNYPTDETPDEIRPSKDCDYIVVETIAKDGNDKKRISRELYNKDEEVIQTLYNLKDSFCSKKIIDVFWDSDIIWN